MLTFRGMKGAAGAFLMLGMLVVAPAGCDDGGGGSGDGGTSDARDVAQQMDLPSIDRYYPDWGGACDPVDQVCPMLGDECVINCPNKTEFVCQASTGGTGAHGDNCTVGSCGKGLVCVALQGGGAKCRKWCKLDTDCPAGKLCTVMGITCKPGSEPPIGWICSP